MIIKPIDDRLQQLNIETLETLKARPDATVSIQKRIEQEIKNIRAGVKGESEAAYEIDFHAKTSKNWMVIHDLRFECEGRVAQIDHIIINRLMEIWVCESKHFAEGVSINELGEFTAFYGGKAYGVPSPIEQNRRHVSVLESVFKTGMVKLPTRIGFNINPKISSFVLVSKNAKISRPKNKFGGIDNVVKNDQFINHINKLIEANNNPLDLAKLISAETLEDFAHRLAEIHQPIAFNYAGKFGLSNSVPDALQLEQSSRKSSVEKRVLKDLGEADLEKSSKQKLICHNCGTSVNYAVAKFCWFNKPKFGGNIFCMECQKIHIINN